ncbi:hypothetical protein [Acidilobus sp.]|uniref:hypothetical protein n=1 Tax=Acidilobus sp. TaxID=1872109 RepID=UPI003CFDE2CA
MISQSLKLKDGETLRVESFKGDRWLEVSKRGAGSRSQSTASGTPPMRWARAS